MGSLLKRNKKIKIYILTIVMLLIGILMVIPFVFMLSGSFKPQALITSEPLKLIPSSIYLANYKLAFSFDNLFFKWYFNSILVVTVTIILRLLVVTMAAYAFARMEVPFKNIIFVTVFAMWMIPSDTTLMARYFVIRRIGLYGSHWAVILNFTFDVFTLFLLRQFFMQVPKDLTEAAVIDGCSHFKIYSKIMLPLCKPAMVTVALFTYIWTWNSFSEPYIFIDKIQNQMLTVGLQYFGGIGGLDIGMIFAGACAGTLPTIILFCIFQKYFVQGIASSGIKG
ncbi:carbohydrate ABC transporter permease [Clostridium estertheticum]|uniref:carbohydrate ABC transporter permease n=1 Tax=Clostridium estertheticum TaxID=238834 RepID=UPI001C0CB6CA|nr:carbohydrate ABC transporter permease [Clostridium estertheticum]MBU3199935.1 carbohydrate ABC transporter permease [Clostridium estertheticum]WAG66967.1 carbohydrate ABC transporter permease [Clostridium estertheticum]